MKRSSAVSCNTDPVPVIPDPDPILVIPDPDRGSPPLRPACLIPLSVMPDLIGHLPYSSFDIPFATVTQLFARNSA